jgi:uncharacterized membrane protein YqaE (UPF0057 family)
MEAVCSSETLINICLTMWCDISEDESFPAVLCFKLTIHVLPQRRGPWYTPVYRNWHIGCFICTQKREGCGGGCLRLSMLVLCCLEMGSSCILLCDHNRVLNGVCAGLPLFTLHVHDALPRLPRSARRRAATADWGHTGSAVLWTSGPDGLGSWTPQHEAHASPRPPVAIWLSSGFQWKVCLHFSVIRFLFKFVEVELKCTANWIKHVSHFKDPFFFLFSCMDNLIGMKSWSSLWFFS